jgi:hypothetical protein
MASSSIECAKCHGAGGWCNFCGAPDCECLPEGGYSGWRACDACGTDGAVEAPEHVDMTVPLAAVPVAAAGDLDVAAELANELQAVRGELAREKRYIMEQQHVAICTAAELERVRGHLEELRNSLQSAGNEALLVASIPFMRACAGLTIARAQLTSGLCAHTRAALAAEQQTSKSTTNRQPARVIELAARKAQVH